MAIKTIEIICSPCPKCDRIKKMIDDAIKIMEMQNKVKIVYDFKHTTHLRDAVKYSVNASQAPIVLINGKVEITGQPLPAVLRSKIEAIHRT